MDNYPNLSIGLKVDSNVLATVSLKRSEIYDAIKDATVDFDCDGNIYTYELSRIYDWWEEDLAVVCHVDEVTSKITDEEVAAVKAVANGLNIGQYYDIYVEAEYYGAYGMVDTFSSHINIELGITQAMKVAGKNYKIVKSTYNDENVVADITDAEKTLIEKAVDSNVKIAEYYDISMKILVDGVHEDWIKETDDTIKITLDIPEEYRKEGRKFYIVRTHYTDGSDTPEVKILNDLDT